MIFDKVCNIKKYRGLSQNIEIAINFIQSIENKYLAIGRIDLENGVYAVVSEYYPIHEKEKKWEAHTKYIDLQCILQGNEIMGYQNRDKMKSSLGYDEKNDIEFFNYNDSYSELIVERDMFTIFFPEDAHAPCIFHKDLKVKKVVVKIPV
jgi:biofilm protein TabA